MVPAEADTRVVSRRARGVVLRAAGLALVLGTLVCGGLSHDGLRDVVTQLRAGTLAATPANAWRGLGAYLANPDDMYRAYAYAQAMLGRPYRPYFVRTRAEWEVAFAHGAESDPDATPAVRPTAPLSPYRDFLLEYPPGFLLAAIPPALVAKDFDGYALAFKLQMALCLLLVALSAGRLARALGVARSRRPRVLGALAACALAIGVVCTHRYDAFVAACMVGGVALAVDGRPRLGGVALGIGVAAKGVPLLLAPLVIAFLLTDEDAGAAVVAARHSTSRRAAFRFAAATLATAGIAIGAAFVAWGPGLRDALAYHAARPVQIEATAGAILAMGSWFAPGLVTVVHSFSSRNLAGASVATAASVTTWLAILGVAAAVAVSALLLARTRERTARVAILLDGILLALGAYVALGKVFCPQYLVWLLPFGLAVIVADGASRWRTWGGLALLVATQIIYPAGYAAVKALAPWATLLVLSRNVGVLAWTVAPFAARLRLARVAAWRAQGGATVVGTS